MRVSTRVEYGMLALADIVLYSENGTSVSAPEIAEREEISQKYLEQILTQLKQAGLIRAQKGLRGRQVKRTDEACAAPSMTVYGRN